MINWKVTKSDAVKISAIVERVIKEGFHPDNAMTVSMDVTACHANGMPLDLDKLLAAPGFDFVHDILGIRKHIDRQTGKIGDCFVPRCASHQGGEHEMTVGEAAAIVVNSIEQTNDGVRIKR